MSLLLAGLICVAACGQRSQPPAFDAKPGKIKDVGPPDGPPACPGCICKDPTGDDDGDGIKNGDEGCLTGRDTDGDKIPDWQDYDSDGDGLYDEFEKGQQDANSKCKGKKPPYDSWPCDTDGDGVPDYLDLDSDGDGLLDDQEDVNGDGQLGCCLTTCNKPLGKQKSVCLLTKAGCGAGQTCVSGQCSPAAAFSCSEGETDPTKTQTYPEGPDNQLATWICRDATADKPQGRKPVQKRVSSAGDWSVALPLTAKYGDVKITNPKPKEAAATIDFTSTEVAGFVISRSTTHATVNEALAFVHKNIEAWLGGTVSVTQIASGVQRKTHDGYEAVHGTTLRLATSGAVAQRAAEARGALLPGLLGRGSWELSNLPAAYGSKHSDLVLRLTTVRRFEFKKDNSGDLLNAQGQKIRTHGGDPVDSGDTSKWRLMTMGAVTSWSSYQGAKSQARFDTDDLSDGSALAKSSHRLVNECDVLTIDRLPTADIIWVVDESGSMTNTNLDLAYNINNLFSRALSSGLDFRMGVTGVNDPKGQYVSSVGSFCSKISSSTTDAGGVDRFLLPSEQTVFSSCIKNPPGYEGSNEYGLVNVAQAVKKHLPRAAGAQDRVRPDAHLAVIVVSDEPPASLLQILGQSTWSGGCTMTAAQQAKYDAVLKPHLSLLSGVTDPQARASVHFIGGLCSTTNCGAVAGIGYLELAHKLGGQSADICQKDLGQSMGVVIDDVVAAASPLKLERQAISASLAVALDGVEIKRSVTNGFDYRAANNTLVLINVKYKKGGKVITSYKYWDRSTWGP